MLVGLAGGSTATVSAGRGGSTSIAQPGKPPRIVLPAITITGTVPKPKPTKPTAVGASPSPFARIEEFFRGLSTGQKLLLGVGVLGLCFWGSNRLGVFKRGGRSRRRWARNSRYARNPRESGVRSESNDPDVQRAIEFRRDFHWGFPAKYVNPRRKIYPDPKVLVMLGKVKAITYQTNKKGERARYFVHDFEKARPELGMDIKNKRLHFVGGSYTVTADGITG